NAGPAGISTSAAAPSPSTQETSGITGSSASASTSAKCDPLSAPTFVIVVPPVLSISAGCKTAFTTAAQLSGPKTTMANTATTSVVGISGASSPSAAAPSGRSNP